MSSAGLLERSGELDALARALASVTSSGQGRIALVAGEAGIGKTALLRRFSASADGLGAGAVGQVRAVVHAPAAGAGRRTGQAIGGEAAARAAGGGRPYDVAMAFLRELAAGPSVLVVEDVHWADEATLDVIRLVGRRVAGVPVLLVLSYREDELDRSHPLRIVLGTCREVIGSPGWSWLACRRGRSRSWPARGRGRRGVAPVDGGEPVLRHRGAGGGQRDRCRARCATRCWRARRGWAGRRGTCLTRPRWCPARSSVAARSVGADGGGGA